MNSTNKTLHTGGDTENSTFQNALIENTRTTRFTLDSLNDDMALTRLGGIVFVAVLMVVGAIGNAHALYIYLCRFKSSNRRIFILSLSTLDFTTCIIGMPFIIADLRNPLKFNYPILCKGLRFLNYIMSVGSICILVIIAIDRYQKICRPMKKPFTRRQSKIACVVSLFIAVAFSWPSLVLFGRSTYRLPVEGLTGITCFTEDQYMYTNYQVYFMVALSVLTGTAGSILIFLYTSIRRAISKQSLSRVHATRIECKKCASLPRNQRLTSDTPPSPFPESCECAEESSSDHSLTPTIDLTMNLRDGQCRSKFECSHNENDDRSKDKLSASSEETDQNNETLPACNLVDLYYIGQATYNRDSVIPRDLIHKLRGDDAPTENGDCGGILPDPEIRFDRSPSTVELLDEQTKTGLENISKQNYLYYLKNIFVSLKINMAKIRSTGHVNKTYKLSQSQNNSPVLRTKKINLMFSAITIVFFVSFIPHLILVTILFADVDYYLGLDVSDLVVYNTFLWTFFINNMANPIIYCFCDPKFRKELNKLYQKSMCSKPSYNLKTQIAVQINYNC